MGFLGSLFAKDWNAEIERAEALLVRDEPVRALEVAERAARRGGPEVAPRAEALATRARAALIDTLLARAEAAVAEGDHRDAADWLLAALEHLEEGPRRDEVARRREELVELAEEADNPFARRPGEPGDGGEAEDDEAVELEAHYEALVSTLEDEVAARYQDRPEEFRRALVDLNEGRAEEALAVLDALLLEDDDDPILHLERGRARLLADRPEEALADLEIAWEELGAGPLDAVDSLSVPLLWAEAAAADGRHQEVVDRLGLVEPPIGERAALAQAYAAALLATGRAAEAIDFLGPALLRFPRDPQLALLMARALVAGGETERAVAGLEERLRPSLGGGRGAPALHPPSVRELCRLYLAEERELDRVGELMAAVARAQGGMMAAADHAVLSRYYQLAGQPEAAARSAAEAERLRGAPDEAASPAPSLLGGRGRIL